MSDFLEQIRQAVRQAGTQADVARRVGCSPAEICRLLNGERTPRLSLLLRILDVLGYRVQVVRKAPKGGDRHG